MGRIGEWAPLAARWPALFNFVAARTKGLAGIAAQRKAPKLAPRTFRAGFAPAGKGAPVLLLDDTFNNHFRPRTAHAAQRVLEAAGCAVELPRERVCCGRPYYDFGMLDEAKAGLENVLRVLGPRLEAGVPLVVLEPGCLSVFRDELKQLFPSDPRAAQLARSVRSLAEVLKERGWERPVGGDFLLHGHCHQKALWGTGAELEVLRGAGCGVSAPDSGCCGMAGSFGYRPQFFEASARIAGLALGPALERAPRAEVIANGYSCREQIEGLLGRPTLHLAEVLERALPRP